jgi:hypothetical protein
VWVSIECSLQEKEVMFRANILDFGLSSSRDISQLLDRVLTFFHEIVR